MSARSERRADHAVALVDRAMRQSGRTLTALEMANVHAVLEVVLRQEYRAGVRTGQKGASRMGRRRAKRDGLKA